MGNEEQNVDEECKQADQEVKDSNDEDYKKISGGMGGRMEVRDEGEDEHYQCDECRNRVDDQDGRQGRPG